MSTIVIPRRAAPSWRSGFARSPAESAHPHLWQGLQGLWVPQLGPTGDTLFDVSGRKNHGTLTNIDPATDWVVGQKGYALDFDGSDDVVDIPTQVVSPTSDMSAVMFANISSVTSRDTFFVQTPDPTLITSTGPFWAILGSQMLVDFFPPSGGAVSSDTLSDYLGVWRHYGFTLQGTSLRFYVDGRDHGGGTSSEVYSGSAPTNTLLFGRTTIGGECLAGKLGMFAIYDRALAPSEIQQLYIDRLAPLRLQPRVFSTAVAEAGSPVTYRLFPDAAPKTAWALKP